MYYYTLLRFHMSNQMHIRNRNNLDKSWKNLVDNRRRLRVLETSYLKRFNNYIFLEK